jgi:hypothetical protein
VGARLRNRPRVRFISALACAVLLLLGCDSAAQSTVTTSPTDSLTAQAATQFEKLDNTYFAASQAATAIGKTIAPDAYQQAMNGMADANHALAQGLQQIPFPDNAKAEAIALRAATVLVETDTLIESQSPGSSNLLNDLDTRNAADKKLRGDLGLDPSEVP